MNGIFGGPEKSSTNMCAPCRTREKLEGEVKKILSRFIYSEQFFLKFFSFTYDAIKQTATCVL
jgi:hypothetical protein